MEDSNENGEMPKLTQVKPSFKAAAKTAHQKGKKEPKESKESVLSKYLRLFESFRVLIHC
jgi:hypothetical protein